MRAIIPTTLDKRISDKWGYGHFKAPRDYGEHHGQDYLCPPEVQVQSPVAGKITKHGIVYKDDHSFKYVRITDKDGKDHRIYYVEPILPIGREVRKGTIIGFSQDLTERYPGIGNHIHYEVLYNGEYLDPETLEEVV